MATKKAANEETPEISQLAFVIHQLQLDFINRAVAELEEGTSRSQFIRDTLMTACKKILQEDPPEVEISRGGGRRDAITVAAEAAGQTRAEFLRATALASLGLAPSAAPKRKRKKAA